PSQIHPLSLHDALPILKRFVTERHGPESRNPIDVFAGTPRPVRQEKIAIIGSGPAGMSAAHDLALLGYTVTIFEAAPVPGGMMQDRKSTRLNSSHRTTS